MSLSVLFVDDESYVLDGLRRMLRNKHKEWDMRFAPGGEEALAMMEEKHFDVIISDMRMPKMDGADLLAEVKKRHPHMVRIILSGQSEKEMALKSVQAAHRYLAKPCDSAKIISTINDACLIRSLLPDAKIRGFFIQMESLPSLPSLYMELMESLNEPDVSTRKIGDIIARDLGMTTKLLKMVNSSFFGLGRNVNDPFQAVKLLGLESIRTLVLTVEVFSIFSDAGKSSLDLDELLTHSMKVANLAKAIALSEGCNEKEKDEAFFAGMLHDVGKLALSTYKKEQYGEVLEKIRVESCSYEAAETEIFKTTHSEAGAYVLCLWGLPVALVKPVAFHHHPLFASDPKEMALMAAALSNAIIKVLESPESVENPYPEEIMEYAEIVGVTGRISAWEALGRDVLQNRGEYE